MDKIKIGKLKRSFERGEIKIDADARIVEFPFSSELPVERWFGKEILAHDKSAVDLTRFNDGANVLYNHDADQVLGVIERSWIGDDKRGYVKVRFSKSAFAQEKFADIQDGILRNVSFGYEIKKLERTVQDETGSTYTASEWEPYEVSIVTIPADHTVGIGRSADDSATEIAVTDLVPAPVIEPEITIKTIEAAASLKGDKMDPKELEAARHEARTQERERSAAISKLCERFKMPELARELLDAGKSIDEAREIVLERVATQKPVSETEADIGLTQTEIREFSFMRAINALANPGNRKLRDAAKFEFEVSEAGAKKRGKESRGLFVPYEILRHKRDLSKGTPSAGGYLVGTDHLAASFIEMLRKKMILDRAGATILNGLHGDVAIPKQLTAATSYWVAEGSAPTESQQTFGQVAMSPKTVGAFVDMSRKLLIQSSPDIEQLVRADLAKVIALAIDNAGLYGSGSSNQPQGLAGGAFVTGLNTLDLASATEMTHAEAISMETSIASDDADVENMKYLASPVQRGGMKAKVKFASTDSLTVWQNNEINGYAALCSSQVASADVFFGNWAELMIGFWSGLDLTVDPSALATSGGLRLIALQDCDVAARHGESFCYANSSIT